MSIIVVHPRLKPLSHIAALFRCRCCCCSTLFLLLLLFRRFFTLIAAMMDEVAMPDVDLAPDPAQPTEDEMRACWAGTKKKPTIGDRSVVVSAMGSILVNQVVKASPTTANLYVQSAYRFEESQRLPA